MSRQGVLALFIACVALICAQPSSGQLTHAKAPKPKVVAEKPKLVPLPEGKKKILVREFLADVRLHGCKGTIVPPPAETVRGPEKIGGFACSTIYLIELRVSGEKVTASPNKLTGVKPGDCIQWKAISTDNTAEVRAINFFDTPQEATDAGKDASQASDAAVGPDLCTGGGRSCVVYIGLADGKYRYQATLNHGGSQKKTDPEVDVSCGTSCGSQDDLPPVP